MFDLEKFKPLKPGIRLTTLSPRCASFYRENPDYLSILLTGEFLKELNEIDNIAVTTYPRQEPLQYAWQCGPNVLVMFKTTNREEALVMLMGAICSTY